MRSASVPATGARTPSAMGMGVNKSPVWAADWPRIRSRKNGMRNRAPNSTA